MASNLVAYDESDSESDDGMNQSTAITKQNLLTESLREDNELPKPSEKELKLAELANREKTNLTKFDLLTSISHRINGKIMIGIPSLVDLDDNTDKKKARAVDNISVAGQSKLFSKLPPPKNSPHEPAFTVSKPVSKDPIKKSLPLIPQSVARQQTLKKDSDDEDISDSFFTMDEPTLKVQVEPMDVGAAFQTITTTTQQDEIVYPIMPTNQQYNMAAMLDSASLYQQREEPGLELDNVALQALQGSSGVKRKLPDDAQIIEIKGERLTYDPNMSYLKAISEEKSNTRGPDIAYNKLQKKKHQITYLAAQAKAREVDLKNQWAQNKSTKRQTQAKYGF
ncbi:proline-rich protein PRCC-like [Daphnia carinata]|uniref:proline-rich protein PRCC-like n=1 Tax=Daphnia carinata TaxID=120202 RepID=UPI0025796819|nr:proline-rich protein PRCC-like [Daphnia carinata]